MRNLMRVIGCPYCEFFDNKKFKYYWIENDGTFAIIKWGKDDIVICGEHITSLSKEQWGRILYRTRKLFGGNVTLKINKGRIKDHWHGIIKGNNRKPELVKQ